MTNRQRSHITRHGKPLCECESHFCGLIGPDSPIRMNGISMMRCEFPSIAAATRAKKVMQRHASGLAVVKGPCPALNERPDK